MDQLVVGFLVVGLIGFFIMTRNGGVNCFTWCDIGKALLMWAITETTIFLIKGPVMGVKIVGQPRSILGGTVGEPSAYESPDTRGIDTLDKVLMGHGGGSSVLSNVVRK